MISPCPYCGSNARTLGNGRPFIDEDDGWEHVCTAVVCNNDQCQAAGPFLASEEQAVEAWNRVAKLAKRESGR